MPAATSDIRIRSLRLRGPDDRRAEVAAALERLDETLAPDDGVLILRTLRISGALPEIGRMALDQARAQGARAADGWDGQADLAEAVRFASRADLLAALLRDLMGQRMRWFWRGWRELFALPPGTAIARVMGGEPLHWSAVIHSLAQRGEAEALWRVLKPADARQLLMSLEQATGWPVCRPRPAQAEREPIRPGLLPGWLRSVAAGQANRSRSDAAVLDLAIVTWLWQSAPQQLAAADAGDRIAGMVAVLRGGARMISAADVMGAGGADRDGGSAPPAPMTESEVRGGNVRALSPIPHVVDTAADFSPSQPPPLAGEEPADGPLQAPRLSPSPQAGSTHAGIKAGVGSASALITNPTSQSVHFTKTVSSPSPETRFITRQGGWFLLLNALALPVFQSRLESGETGADLAVGWLWLHRLGCALGGQADPPLANFIADAAGLPDAESLLAQPPLAHEAELARLAQARYGETVCNAGLFPVPALVLASPSHLDVHFRMADIRLDVRRAGLDIDPGWLPWLGRVVRFHYGEVPELMGLEA